jgi:hypothetical protein
MAVDDSGEIKPDSSPTENQPSQVLLHLGKEAQTAHVFTVNKSLKPLVKEHG